MTKIWLQLSKSKFSNFSVKMQPTRFFKFVLNTILMNRLTLFSLLIFFSCSKEDSEDTPTETIKYTVSITAGEGGIVSTSR